MSCDLFKSFIISINTHEVNANPSTRENGFKKAAKGIGLIVYFQ